MIERSEADVLLAHSLDRLSRHQIDVAVIVDRIEAAHGELALVTEDFENSPVGTFIRSARAFAAEVELAKITERTARGRRARLDSGKPLAGRRPAFGYIWADEEKSRLELNPDTAPIVRSIFDRYLNGGSLRAIALDLTRRGIPTPSGIGQTWSASWSIAFSAIRAMRADIPRSRDAGNARRAVSLIAAGLRATTS